MTGEIQNAIDSVSSIPFAIWFLIGAALVFFMQCGFAMVETGFTRAKNAGNIIMKNLMDFCIGTVTFILLGFGLMMSEDYVAGIIGVPNLGIFTDYGNFDYSSFVFQLVFCATAAQLFPVPWLKEQSLVLIVFIQQQSAQLYIQLKPDGFGIQKAG